MSAYRPGHEEGHDSYINYAAQAEGHPSRGFGGHHQTIQHGGPANINPLHGDHLGQHPHAHTLPPQHQYSQHTVYANPQGMAQPQPHQQQPSPQYSNRQEMMHPGPSMQQGLKRQRSEHLGMGGMGGMSEQQMHPGEMGMGSQLAQQQMAGYSAGAFHSHVMPNSSSAGGKKPRLDDEPSQMSMGAPSVVGMEGMPEPSARPRGPKLKFTPEDDQKLVDLKENKSLTWKQIADFFPGRSSGTLQVRYCTKLKAKTTQWTDETVQKLQTALHDYEQEKWRIIAQKVGTGFTSAACKEKAEELVGEGEL